MRIDYRYVMFCSWVPPLFFHIVGFHFFFCDFRRFPRFSAHAFVMMLLKIPYISEEFSIF